MNDIKSILMSKIFSRVFIPKDSEKTSYQNEIKLISAQLACLDTWFQLEDDSDLMDACIYQRESLNAQYRYFIKKSKENNMAMSSVAQ